MFGLTDKQMTAVACYDKIIQGVALLAFCDKPELDAVAAKFNHLESRNYDEPTTDKIALAVAEYCIALGRYNQEG